VTGVCSTCGREVQVRSTRGSRLTDVACPHCGGALQGKTKGRSRPSGKIVLCVICGRKRRDGAATLKRPTFAFEDRWGRSFGASNNPGPHAAGEPCCWSHELVPTGLEADLEAQLGSLVAARQGRIFFTNELQRGEQEALAAHLKLAEASTVGRAILPVQELVALAVEHGLNAGTSSPDSERSYWPLVLSAQDRLLFADPDDLVRLGVAAAAGVERVC
jgi:DNA-directed RNA polymerase subunit RPC12/RpoP